MTLGPMAALTQAFSRALAEYGNQLVAPEAPLGVPRIECPCGARLSQKSFRRHLREVHGAKNKTKKWKRPGELRARR